MIAKSSSNRMYASLLLLALLGAAATNHVADAVFAATPASPARDQGEGWYFREYAIEVGSNPGPGMTFCMHYYTRFRYPFLLY